MSRLRRGLATALVRAVFAVGASVSVALALHPGEKAPAAQLEVVDGTISISNSRGGAAILSAHGMSPGESASGSVTITNAGSVRGDFSLSSFGVIDLPGGGGGLLSTVLLATVTDVTDANAPVELYSGPLGAMPTRPLGSFHAGERRTYRFEVRMPELAEQFQAVQGGATTISYRWQATGEDDGADPNPRPPVTDPPPARPPTTNPPTTAPPAAPLSLRLSGTRKWSIRKRRRPAVTASCTSTCALRATVKVKGPRRRVRLKVKSRALASAAGRSMKLTIVVPRRARKLLRTALRRHRRTSIVVKVTGTGPEGQRATAKRTIRVTR